MITHSNAGVGFDIIVSFTQMRKTAIAEQNITLNFLSFRMKKKIKAI